MVSEIAVARVDGGAVVAAGIFGFWWWRSRGDIGASSLSEPRFGALE